MTSRDAVDALLDSWDQRGRDLARDANIRWYAEEIIREADDLWKLYGPPPGPGDRVGVYLAMVRHFVELATAPETPTGGVSGKEAPSVGPAVDIDGNDDISGALADLLTNDTDGDRP